MSLLTADEREAFVETVREQILHDTKDPLFLAGMKAAAYSLLHGSKSGRPTSGWLENADGTRVEAMSPAAVSFVDTLLNSFAVFQGSPEGEMVLDVLVEAATRELAAMGYTCDMERIQ